LDFIEEVDSADFVWRAWCVNLKGYAIIAEVVLVYKEEKYVIAATSGEIR
jgi:hypothetical protein